MDAKAKVSVGDYSRGGESRGVEPVKALDHDPEPEQKLIPQGILDLTSCSLSIFIGTSNGTSDFLADCLDQWWEANRGTYVDFAAPGVRLWTAGGKDGGRFRSGTSYAAPFVAAAIGMKRAATPERPIADLLQELAARAEDLGDTGRDPLYGHGLLQTGYICEAGLTAGPR